MGKLWNVQKHLTWIPQVNRLIGNRWKNSSVVYKKGWGKVHQFVKHNCEKDITLCAREHFVKPLSANKVQQQIISFHFYLTFTQRPYFWYKGCKRLNVNNSKMCRCNSMVIFELIVCGELVLNRSLYKWSLSFVSEKENRQYGPVTNTKHRLKNDH